MRSETYVLKGSEMLLTNVPARLRFKQAFPRGKALLPVIHVIDVVQTKHNAAQAFEEGADGVMLIGHEITDEMLKCIYEEVRYAFPENRYWIGVNFLNRNGTAALEYSDTSMSGIWCDDGEREAARLDCLRRQSRTVCQGLLFGGVAFKGQPRTEPPDIAARQAARFIDVVTTSGPMTGQEPSLEKIRSMRRAIGTHPLACASGMSLDNIGTFGGLVDAILVGTSLIGRGGHFVPGRIEKMRKRF